MFNFLRERKYSQVPQHYLAPNPTPRPVQLTWVFPEFYRRRQPDTREGGERTVHLLAELVQCERIRGKFYGIIVPEARAHTFDKNGFPILTRAVDD